MGNYSVIKNFCTSNGPGVRTSIYLSGCSIHCKGCFNYEIWDFQSGKPVDNNVIKEVLDSLEPDYISGLSILGGEPMDLLNQHTTLELAKAVKERFGDKKTVWLWTGYTVGENVPHFDKITNEIFKYVDVIVDGPFILEQQDVNLKYAGSKNQRVLERGKDF